VKRNNLVLAKPKLAKQNNLTASRFGKSLLNYRLVLYYLSIMLSFF